MGRATFDSIGRPLPGRQNIVLSTTMPEREGVTVIRNAAELPLVCGDAETVFVIGGARVFEELLPQCDGLYLTWIAEPYEGDVLLPPFENHFKLKEMIGQSEGLDFRYYERLANVK
jgi:dihydrofolate reductase